VGPVLLPQIQVLQYLLNHILFVYNAYHLHLASADEDPKLLHLKEWLDEQKLRGRGGLWTESDKRAIDCLCFGNTGKAFNSNEELDIEDLIKKNIVFELDNLGAEIRAFFTSYIMLRIYLYAKNQNKQDLRQVLIFDEGHRIFRKQNDIDIGERITATMCRELRSFGCGLIISTQHPFKLSLEAFGNTYTKICFNLNIEKEINTACGSLLLHGDKKDYVNKLKVGQAIVKLSDRIIEPFLIQTVNLSKEINSVPDELIQGFMTTNELIHANNQIDSIDSNTGKVVQPNSSNLGLFPKTAKYKISNIELDMNELFFIKELIKNPLLNTTAIYKRLGFSSAIGNKIKYSLIKQEIIKPVKIQQKHGQTILLEITQTGRELLKSRYNINISINNRIGGLKHQYWQYKISNHFKQKGYKVILEYPVGNGKTIEI